jgi:integrase
MGIFWDKNEGCFVGSKFINGRRKRKNLRKARTEKERIEMYFKWVAETSASSDMSKILFSKYFEDEWCEVIGKSLDPKTLGHYKRAVKLVMQYRPKAKLKDIDVKFLEKLKTEWVDGGITLPKIHKSIKNIKKVQNDARKWGDAPLVTWRDVQNVKVVKERGNEPFWPHESELLVERAKRKKTETLLKGTLLGMYAGMRDAECCYLDKKDLDFIREIIHVRHKPTKDSRVRGGIWYPKGKKDREIPMHEILKPYLIRWVSQDRSPHIIHNEKTGDRIYPDSLSEMYSEFVKECGLVGTHHKLRHTFITFSIASGVDLVTLQKWTGHKELKVLLEYAHWVPATNKKIKMVGIYESEKLTHNPTHT